MKILNGVIDKNLIKSSGVVGIGTFISEILGFIFLLILARLYSRADWGFISYTITVGVLIATIVVAGYPSALVRFIAKSSGKKEKINEYFTNIVLITVCLLFVVILCTSIIYNFNIWLVSIILGYSIIMVYLGVIRGFIDYKKIALFQIIRNLVKVIVLVLLCFVVFIKSPFLVILLYGFGGWIAIVFLEIVKPTKIKFSFKHISKKIMTEITIFSIPVMISTFAYTALQSIPIIIIKMFYDYDIVGLYTAAFTITTVFRFVPLALVTITMPKISSVENKKLRIKYVTQSFWLVLLTGVIGYFIIVLFGKTIMGLLLTEKYVLAFPLLLILSLGTILSGLRNVFCSLWEGGGRPIVATIDLTIATVVCIALSFYLVPIMGYIGVAYGYSLGFFTAVIIDIVYWIRYRYSGQFILN